MEIRYIDQTFTANTPTEVGIGGRYFNVVSVVNPITLEVGNNGAFNAKVLNAIAGDQGKCADGEPSFTSLRITTTGNENVKIIVTDGQITRTAQSADVSDRGGRLIGTPWGSLGVALLQILSNGLNLLAVLAHGTLGQLAQLALGGVNTLVTSERGYTYASSASNSAANAATTPIALVAPGSNVNGLIVWSGAVWARSVVAGQTMSLLAKSSAPTSDIDGDVLCGTEGSVELAGPISHAWGAIKRPVFVAAGKGVYKMNSQAEANQRSSILYTLL